MCNKLCTMRLLWAGTNGLKLPQADWVRRTGNHGGVRCGGGDGKENEWTDFVAGVLRVFLQENRCIRTRKMGVARKRGESDWISVKRLPRWLAIAPGVTAEKLQFKIMSTPKYPKNCASYAQVSGTSCYVVAWLKILLCSVSCFILFVSRCRR